MRIVNFGQVMDLDSGVDFVHQMTVEHPDGRRFVIKTDEATVQQLIQSMTGGGTEVEPGNGAVKAFPMHHTSTGDLSMFPPPPYQEDEETDNIFGGDFDPGEEQEDDQPVAPVVGTIAEDRVPTMGGSVGGIGQPAIAKPEPEPVQQQLQPAPARAPKRPLIDKDGFMLSPPAKTVQKDEMGYPIVEKRAAPAQPSVGHLGPYAEDDDGNQI